MQKDQQRLYTLRLAKEPLEDVLLALEKLGEMPRKEYEPAMLDIGALIALVSTCTIARHNRVEIARNTVLVCWRCPECNCTASGWIQPQDFHVRRCQGIPRSGSTAVNRLGKPICGAALKETYREVKEESHEVLAV